DIAALKASQLPTLRPELAAEMETAILAAKAAQDSVGGVIECMITGLPAGLGAPFFDSVESQLAHLLFAIPAVKGVSFGAGFGFASLPGSRANDPWRTGDGKIITEGNNCGGVLGGITNGMPVIFRCCVRATPSIGQSQRTVSLKSGAEAEISVQGRHDPCVLPRAVPVVEAMAAIACMDLWKERAGCLRG
ncbi:MAG: chorismate synthase, partial [Clostridia bacterium]|nr:chorismate synthase [Clostridia bacterium]